MRRGYSTDRQGASMKRSLAIVLGLLCLAMFVSVNARAANPRIQVTVIQRGQPARGAVVEVRMMFSGRINIGQGVTDRDGHVRMFVYEHSTRNCWIAKEPYRRIHSPTECFDGKEQPLSIVLQLPSISGKSAGRDRESDRHLTAR